MSKNVQAYRDINLEKLNERITRTISTENALKEVSPMEWTEEVMSGQEKVIIKRRN